MVQFCLCSSKGYGNCCNACIPIQRNFLMQNLWCKGLYSLKSPLKINSKCGTLCVLLKIKLQWTAAFIEFTVCSLPVLYYRENFVFLWFLQPISGPFSLKSVWMRQPKLRTRVLLRWLYRTSIQNAPGMNSRLCTIQINRRRQITVPCIPFATVVCNVPSTRRNTSFIENFRTFTEAMYWSRGLPGCDAV
jgi:hypothetical protein